MSHKDVGLFFFCNKAQTKWFFLKHESQWFFWHFLPEQLMVRHHAKRRKGGERLPSLTFFFLTQRREEAVLVLQVKGTHRLSRKREGGREETCNSLSLSHPLTSVESKEVSVLMPHLLVLLSLPPSLPPPPPPPPSPGAKVLVGGFHPPCSATLLSNVLVLAFDSVPRLSHVSTTIGNLFLFLGNLNPVRIPCGFTLKL